MIGLGTQDVLRRAHGSFEELHVAHAGSLPGTGNAPKNKLHGTRLRFPFLANLCIGIDVTEVTSYPDVPSERMLRGSVLLAGSVRAHNWHALSPG